MGDGYFGFKDPRTAELMPLWHQIFNELKLAPKLVLCLRNPAQVARSLDNVTGSIPQSGNIGGSSISSIFFDIAANLISARWNTKSGSTIPRPISKN